MNNLREIFRAALQHILKSSKHGDKSLLAKNAAVPVSTLLNVESGRRGASEENRRKIAKALGFKYEDFLELGRKILAGEKPLHTTSPPLYDETKIPQQAAVMIEKILYIAEKRTKELPYINAVVDYIYDKVK